MRKTLTAVAAAATIGIATLATPTTADARWGWWGPPAYSYYPAGYYGYYAPAYSYSYAVPAYYGYAYAPRPYYSCLRGRYGYRYRVC
ncbi:MAG: hypothetical protein JO012_01095 [Hyphomicrobiales bacterium]|nr:hypothetical protein [Hyphomicrobiales bacterium]